MAISYTIDYYKVKPDLVLFIENQFSKSIHQNVFFYHYDQLITFSDQVVFNKITWNYNPQLFCLEYYDQYEFYPIVLLVNNIKNIYDFNSENFRKKHIIAPKKDFILQLFRNYHGK